MGSFLCILTALQSLLFAAGLRPPPAQATAVSWVNFINDGRILALICVSLLVFINIVDEQILKDEMQHVGKLICSNLGARMDSEPNHWRILGVGWGLTRRGFICCS